jgi:hypothetical protein
MSEKNLTSCANCNYFDVISTGVSRIKNEVDSKVNYTLEYNCPKNPVWLKNHNLKSKGCRHWKINEDMR